MKVLIVTRHDDNESVDLVLHGLKKAGHQGYRLDSDLYPQNVLVSTEVAQRATRRWALTAQGQRLDLEQVGAIWYRRFNAGALLPDELGDTRNACIDEARRTLYGTIAATRCFQLDPLRAVRRCDHKELQLRIAREVGLTIPRTLFSNEPDVVRKFVRSVKGPVISKMQHSFAIYRQGIENVVFTNVVTPDDLDDKLDGLQFCPMTFQEQVPKAVELRATVVGRRVFTAAVDSNAIPDASVDWRRQGVPLIDSWVEYALPKAVERGLLKLTKWFGLNYAAADFIVTPSGQHYFLEINAGGEFFWLQRTPGLPIVDGLVDCLTKPAARAVAGEA